MLRSLSSRSLPVHKVGSARAVMIDDWLGSENESFLKVGLIIKVPVPAVLKRTVWLSLGTGKEPFGISVLVTGGNWN